MMSSLKGEKKLYAALRPSDMAIKIGISRVPKKRLYHLRHLDLVYESRLTRWPWVAEKMIHLVLKNYGVHVDGEFFRISLDQARAIIDSMLECVAAASLEQEWLFGLDQVRFDRLPYLLPPEAGADMRAIRNITKHRGDRELNRYIAQADATLVTAHNSPGVGIGGDE